MPKRIYALAKELKIDSKQLVTVCNKAGVTGKGSALASLDDDEIAKVKAYLAGGKGKAAKPSGPLLGKKSEDSAPISRDDYIVPSQNTGKIKVIAPKRAAKAPEVEEPTAVEPIDVEPVDVEEPQELAAEQATPSEETPEEVTPEKPAKRPLGGVRASSTPSPMERPKSSAQKVIQTLRSGSSSAKKKEGARKAVARKEPVIKLASMPQVKQKAQPAKKKEPAPQKPIMKLPQDAIRSKAPLEQFTKQHDKKRKKGGQGAQGGKPDATAPVKGEAATTARVGRRRGKGGAATGTGTEEEGKGRGLAGMAGSRQARQQHRKRRGGRGDDDSGRRRRGPTRLVRKGTNTAEPRKTNVQLETPCSLRAFSEATGVGTAVLQRKLMQMGVMATITTELDFDTAELIAAELDLQVDFKEAASLEEKVLTQLNEIVDVEEDLVTRPPVITFLGHVDHGKTSLLDAIIGLKVVDGEAGGITQHIRAYTIKKDGRTISFVDTPGHEAFTEMRARGANVTDIAVLVVAADDGIMPQTEEAIAHAKAAEVPIVVAMNKMDVPGADPEKVYQQLSTHELLPSEWGGETEVVKTSAITGEGLDDLLETLLLTADLHEYTANPNRVANGTCLEAEQEPGRGVVAKVIVQKGTMKVGDVVVCGSSHGRIKAMFDTLHTRKKVKSAGPSVSVNITGLDKAPGAGDAFFVMDDISKAREIASTRADDSRNQSLSGRGRRHVTFEEFQKRLEEGRLAGGDEPAILNLIIRADVRGSIEAIQKELQKLDHPEVQLQIRQASVGGVTLADVMLADATDAVIVGFNVIPDEIARAEAENKGVEFRRYDVIYKVTEDLRAMLEGKLKPEEYTVELGRALVQQTFTISRVGTIAGCRVLSGTIERNCRIRVNRDGRGIGEYPLDSLKREKDDAKEVREGFECGIKLKGFNDIKEGDVLEAYRVEERARTF